MKRHCLAGLLLLGQIPTSSAQGVKESFDNGWSFARFGLQADGSRLAEPGTGAGWSHQLTASSEESAPGREHPPQLAMDNDPSTRWCASGGAADQWLAVDLGKPAQLKGMSIDWDVTGAWKNPDLPYAFVVEGIAGDGNWRVLADFTKQAASNPSRVPLTGEFRHIRVRTTECKGSQWASIRELTLTGADGKPLANKPVPAGDSPSAAGFDDTSWRKLDLPHDWGIEGPFRLDLEGGTGKLPWKGIGWYRKTFTLPAADADKRVYLDFDGAMAYAEVWCNGKPAGSRPYGYSSFRVDLTPHLNKPGSPNTIAVRLNTEKWDSRWYPGAGIYRHTWLVKTAPVHVGHWGVYVTTPELTDRKGVANLAVTVDNTTGSAKNVQVVAQILALDTRNHPGKPVAATEVSPLTIAAGSSAVAKLSATVPSPARWTTWDAGNGKPARYLARVIVKMDGKVVDTFDRSFGFRTIEFTARDGFKLNGKRLHIKGVCQHHDLGALGAAHNDRALERQFEMLKEMGVNSWRTSHNPPSPEVIEFADRFGFLVWDEAFDCWKKGKRANDYNKLYDQWHETDLRDLVRRDRSNPSVFIWSIGNEVHEQSNVEMTRHLVDIMKSEDPTRPVSNGYNSPDGGRGSGACVALDIMGVNYFFGQQDKWDKDPRYSNKPTIGSETSSCVSSRGEYFFPGDTGGKMPGGRELNWQITSYDTEKPGWGCTPDTQFGYFRRWPHLLGEYVWTGFDYLGEPTPYNSDATNLLNFRNDPAKKAELEAELAKIAASKAPSRSSYFGIIDLAGFPKDRFYLYQAEWRPDLPMAHLLPHWNWPDRAGKTTPVHLYTSGDEAELFLNGKSLGRKKRGPNDFRLRWDDVKYEPGELKAVAYRNGKPWANAITRTTGPAAKLDLTADRSSIRADGRDLSFITVRVADEKGLTVPRSSNTIRFSIEGPGEIVAVDNGDATSFEPFQAKQRKAFNGLALVIVRSAPGKPGNFTLTATSEGLAPASVRVGGN